MTFFSLEDPDGPVLSCVGLFLWLTDEFVSDGRR